MGEVMGLMNEGEKHKLITQLVDKVWESCTVKDDETHGAALWRVTALLILTPGCCLISIEGNFLLFFFLLIFCCYYYH